MQDNSQNHYLPNRKRLISDNDAQSVSMETGGHPQFFLLESYSEVSDMDFEHKLDDIIYQVE